MGNRNLLVLDDDELVGAFVRRLASELGYAVRVSSTVEAFRAHFWAQSPDEIVLDLWLGESDGIEVLRFLSAQGCRARITLLSGIDSRTLDAARAFAETVGLSVGAALSKPVRANELRTALAPLDAGVAAITAETLAAGIKNGELVLEYQPIITCASGKLSGLEALVRWQRPGGSRIPPDQFIPLAEAEPDLMDELTFSVAGRAAQDWHVLSKSGFDGHIALNISAQNLRRLDFPERFASLIHDGGLPANKVTLELTETAAMNDPLVSLDVLVRLRLRGFTLAVDDFGTGYSSLAMLRRLPYSELKIDRSFVKDILASHDALAIVKAVLALAQNMGLNTVAEGVEDSQILSMLTDFGATCAQGFGISRPLALPKLVEWIGAQAADDATLSAVMTQGRSQPAVSLARSGAKHDDGAGFSTDKLAH